MSDNASDCLRPGSGQDFVPGQSRVGWMFSAIWLIYLGGPLFDLFNQKHSGVEVGLVLAGMSVFCLGYVHLVILADRDWDELPPDQLGSRRKLVWLGVLTAITLALSLRSDSSWGVLWIYVSSACALALPTSPRRPWAVFASFSACLAMVVEAVALGVPSADWLEALLPGVFAALVVIGVRKMHELILELRQARAEVVRLAASEERLRMARDLHDLAGHSLATITLKAELAPASCCGWIRTRPSSRCSTSNSSPGSRWPTSGTRYPDTGVRRSRWKAPRRARPSRWPGWSWTSTGCSCCAPGSWTPTRSPRWPGACARR